jgi:hypothetical protein
MCGRVVQVSDPIKLSIVDGLNVRDTRLSNYPEDGTVRQVAYQNKRVVYNLLMKAASVLHTWGSPTTPQGASLCRKIPAAASHGSAESRPPNETRTPRNGSQFIEAPLSIPLLCLSREDNYCL